MEIALDKMWNLNNPHLNYTPHKRHYLLLMDNEIKPGIILINWNGQEHQRLFF